MTAKLGPYRAERKGATWRDWQLVNPDGAIGEVYGCEATARLLATAPEMYQLLQEIADGQWDKPGVYGHVSGRVRDKAAEVVAKADGERG